MKGRWPYKMTVCFIAALRKTLGGKKSSMYILTSTNWNFNRESKNTVDNVGLPASQCTAVELMCVCQVPQSPQGQSVES